MERIAKVRTRVPDPALGAVPRAVRSAVLGVILTVLPLTAPAALAQGDAPPAASAEAEAVLEDIRAAAEAITDASFLLTGTLIDPDGTEIALEVETEIIPEARAARAYFLQPDALADNFIVLNGDAVWNYTFLTNQVTVLDADDPDALGGLFGVSDPEAEAEAAAEGAGFDFTFDLEELFAGWEATVTGTTDTPLGPATVLRFDNREEGASIAWSEAVVPESTDLPYRIVLHEADDGVLAELVFEDLALDQGLAVEDVTYVPEDAEVIDERE